MTHRERAKQILAAHPEVRGLVGRNPWTLAIAVLLVAIQIGVAAWLSTLSWWWGVLAAALFGAHVVHALYAIVHEATHRLVLRGARANRVVMLLCNVPLVAPFAVALGHHHLVHHRRLGEWGRDPDMPSAWERRVFAGGAWRKLAYAALFPVLQLFRPVHRDDRLRLGDPWLIANVVVQLLVVAAIAVTLGWGAIGYLLLSVYFWGGPHPVLFARFVQEHFSTSDDGEETHSYYGPLNRITLNVGFHVEHHDIASIPWNRLPVLTRIASGFYAERTRHVSWWRLFCQYLFDPRVQLANRCARLGADDAEVALAGGAIGRARDAVVGGRADAVPHGSALAVSVEPSRDQEQDGVGARRRRGGDREGAREQRLQGGAAAG